MTILLTVDPLAPLGQLRLSEGDPETRPSDPETH
jgi:hypothetical protein